MGKRKTPTNTVKDVAAPTASIPEAVAPAAPAAPDQEAKATTGRAVRVTAPVALVRPEPTRNAGATAKLKRGDIVTITKTRGPFGLLASGAGWINLNFTEDL